MATDIADTTIILNLRHIHSAVLSYTSSKRYLRRMFKLCILNIMFNRINMPAEEFEEQKIQDVKYVAFKRSTKHRLIQQFFRWTKGTLHAFERDYLKDFYLLIKDQNDALKEYYKFSFRYNGDIHSKSEVDKNVLYTNTCSLLSNINDLSGHQKWDENDISLTAEIVYNDKAPLIYDPPYFEPSNSNIIKAIKKIHQKVKRNKLQSINTGYHAMLCRFAGENIKNVRSRSSTPAIDLCESESEIMHIALNEFTDSYSCQRMLANNTENTNFIISIFPFISSHSSLLPKKLDTLRCRTKLIGTFTKRKPTMNVNSPDVGRSDSVSTNPPHDVDEVEIAQYTDTCICNSNVSDRTLAMIPCKQCKKLFHCACFGFIKPAHAPKRFLCLDCGGTANTPSGMDCANKLPFYRFRLLTAYSFLTSTLPNKIIANFPIDDQTNLWTQLEQLEIIVNIGDTYVVNYQKIKEELPLYFFNHAERDNVEGQPLKIFRAV